MPAHKFKIGENVLLERTIGILGGAYVVTRQLPERDGEFEYLIKSVAEPHQRAARESQLRKNSTVERQAVLRK